MLVSSVFANCFLVLCSDATCCDRCIFLDDLMRFMNKDEALKTIGLFGAASEHDGISKCTLKNWVVMLNALTIFIII